MTGILGSANLLNGPSQSIYINGKNAATVATVNICNRNPTRSALVRIAVSTSETPAIDDWIEYDTEIGPNGVLERNGIWVDSLEYIVVRSNMPNVTAVAWGISKGSAVSAPTLTPVSIGTVTWSTAASLPSGVPNVPYRTQLIANDSNGGTVFYSLSSGSLPAGFGLTTTGVIEGVATVTGTATFTITASNGTNTTNRTFTLQIQPVSTQVTGGTTTFISGIPTTTYTTTGTFQTQTAALVEILMWGAGGAGGRVGGWGNGAPGGAGGFASGRFIMQAGQTLTVSAGAGGVVGSTSEVRGGGGIASLNLLDNQYGSGGGGYSAVFFTNNVQQDQVLLLAGGGGGGGSSRAGTGNQGGAGGGLTGQDGVSPYDGKTAYRGRGGTQTAAGADASSDAVNNPSNQGALRGGSPRVNSYGGAGGGGYWGGSGGGYSEANTMGGGGGGSGYAHPLVLSPTLTTGNLTTAANSASSFRTLGGYNAGDAGGVNTNGQAGLIVIRVL